MNFTFNIFSTLKLSCVAPKDIYLHLFFKNIIIVFDIMNICHIFIRGETNNAIRKTSLYSKYSCFSNVGSNSNTQGSFPPKFTLLKPLLVIRLRIFR